MALPVSTVDQVGLVSCGESRLMLADITTRFVEFYSVDVEWDGSYQNLVVSAVGEECLIGMQFLEGYELQLEVKHGGSVTIEKL